MRIKDTQNQTDKSGASQGGTGFQPVAGFKSTRRNLPHMQEPGRTYFITFRVRAGLIPEQVRRIVLDACLFLDRRKAVAHACVVMPDHVHLLITPLRKANGGGYFSLSEILHSIKSYSATRINKVLGRSGPFWLDESFDRIVRSEKDFLEKWNYIRNNPAKRGLVNVPEEYPFLFENCRYYPVTGKDAGATRDEAVG